MIGRGANGYQPTEGIRVEQIGGPVDWRASEREPVIETQLVMSIRPDRATRAVVLVRDRLSHEVGMAAVAVVPRFSDVSELPDVGTESGKNP